MQIPDEGIQDLCEAVFAIDNPHILGFQCSYSPTHAPDAMIVGSNRQWPGFQN